MADFRSVLLFQSVYRHIYVHVFYRKGKKMDRMGLKNIVTGDRSKFEIIPLGINCDISHYLRRSGLRATAFPFDWNITPIQAAVELIRNDFEKFLDRSNLAFLPPVNRLLFDEDGVEVEIKNDVITPTVCRRYHILFPHDFPRSGAEQLGDVKDKYNRRIDRLISLLQSEIHLIFVAHDGQLNDWQQEQYVAALGEQLTNCYGEWELELATVLDEKYPGLNYSLCNLGYFNSQVDTV